MNLLNTTFIHEEDRIKERSKVLCVSIRANVVSFVRAEMKGEPWRVRRQFGRA